MPATTRPIRVCYVIDRLQVAGTENQLLALIAGLDRSRVEPTLCLLDGEDEVSRSLEPADCTIIRLGIRSLKSPTTLARAYKLASYLRREKIDVVQTCLIDSTYFGVFTARLAGVPYIVRSRRNLGHWMTPAHRWMGKLCNRFTHATVANCEAARQSLLADEAPDPASVIVVENGLELDSLSSLPVYTPPTEPRTLRVGCVANLRPVKALDLLVRAMAHVSAWFPQAVCEIVGEGDQRAELEKLIAEQELAGKFILRGAERDVRGFLGSLDVAVLCSDAEGLSNAVIEYMAAGRPIVVTDVGGNSDLIEHEVQGLVVPRRDEVALAASIARLLAEPVEAARMAASARQKALARYERGAMVRRFENFYTQLVAEGATS